MKIKREREGERKRGREKKVYNEICILLFYGNNFGAFTLA